MSLVVLGRPRLKPADSAWITALRERHGSALAAPEIGTHVTLVFPTDVTDATTLTGHMAMVAGDTAPLALAFRCALPVQDPGSGDTYVYLVPDEGFSGLVRLHDRLYSGPFADALNLDIPYIPHITLDRGHQRTIATKTIRHQREAAGIHIVQKQLPTLARQNLRASQTETAGGAGNERPLARITLG